MTLTSCPHNMFERHRKYVQTTSEIMCRWHENTLDWICSSLKGERSVKYTPLWQFRAMQDNFLKDVSEKIVTNVYQLLKDLCTCWRHTCFWMRDVRVNLFYNHWGYPRTRQVNLRITANNSGKAAEWVLRSQQRMSLKCKELKDTLPGATAT